jgi:hypothetical protein
MSPRIRGSGGGGGGGGLSESAADLIYLRLDASNDPVTGQLSFADGSGIDLTHTQGEKDDTEKYDVVMSSIGNPGTAAFYGSWIDKNTPSSDDFNDTWAATITGTRIGATGGILRVGVIAGINPAADLKGHFLPRHAETGSIAPIYDLGGPTTSEGVIHQWRDLYLSGDIFIDGVIQGLISKQDSVSPGPTDDSDSGFRIGSRWLNTSTNQDYVATSVGVGTAEWEETTGAGSGVTRAYVPAGIIVSVPDRHQIVVSGLFEIEATGTLDIEAGGKLVILEEAA